MPRTHRTTPRAKRPALEPRKWPRQARSQASFDAILGGCARILRRDGLGAATTNRIAAEAGVGIGTLYEFFPSREAILAVLCHRRLEALGDQVSAALATTRGEPIEKTLRHVVGTIVDGVYAERWLFRVLLREAPLLRESPEMRRRIEGLLDLGRAERERREGRRLSPSEEASNWLVGRMVAGAVVDIAFAGRRDPPQEALKEQLANLVLQMRIVSR